MNESEKAVAEVLLKARALTKEQLDSAVRFKNQNGMSLEDALVRLRMVGEDAVAQALSKVCGIPFASRANKILSAEKGQGLESLIDGVFARDNCVLPLYLEDGRLHAAMAAPQGGVLGTALALKTGKAVACFVAPVSELVEAIEEFYR